MALQDRNANLTYLRLKEGKFYETKDGKPWPELYGTITGLRYVDDDYQGTKTRKLAVTISDEGVNYQIKLNVETGYYSSLVSFLANVDITKPVLLQPSSSAVEGKEYKNTIIFVKQNGVSAKGYFTKATPHGRPDWTIVQVGSKKVIDKTDYLNFFEDYVLKNLVPKLTNKPAEGTKVVAAEKPALTTAPVDTSFDTQGETVNQTPWDD